MSVVGVLGGSFDPVHWGHVELARRALDELALERVLLLPCADPPHKPRRALAARHHRLEMLYLATEDRRELDVCTYEIARGGVRFTIDTLRALRQESPATAPVFLCGSDAIAEIDSWRCHDALLAEFDFVTASRAHDGAGAHDAPLPAGVARRLAASAERPHPPLGAGGRIFRLTASLPAVSSSLVRSRSSEECALTDLVPAKVARYIQRHRLYTEEETR